MIRNYLWTPWRMQYVGGDSGSGAGSPTEPKENAPEPLMPQPELASTGCVFCDKPRMDPRHDRANLVLYRGDQCFIILNLYPYNSAHLMAVPYLHTADYANLDQETTGEMTALVQRALKAIADEYKPEGFNIGMNLGRVAGAGVADHLHTHVVPRWAGDSNFMPIVGATKVMPELLETTYDRLKPRLISR